MELGDILYRGSRSAGDLSFIMSETPETYQAGSERYTELLRAEEYYNRAETLYDRGDGTSPPCLMKHSTDEPISDTP
jgi:hypothetical protein